MKKPKNLLIRIAMIENKILIVDEDKFIRETIGAFLLNQGYDVKTAESSKRALNALGNEKFPIVLTALKMSGLDGIEMCKHIKQRNVKCIVYAFSSYLKDYDLLELESFGFDGHINKPIRKEILAAAIKGAVDKLRRSKPVAPAFEQEAV